LAYRLVIFDFDGTLADTYDWFLGAVEAAAPRFGVALPDPATRETLRGVPTREVVRRMGVPRWKMILIAKHLRRRKEQAAPGLQLFAGVAELLEALSARGTALAIVSSDGEVSVRATLGALASRIGIYDCGAPLFGKKRRLKRVLRRVGVRPEEAIFIGDETRDAEAAREAGIAFGAVSWGYARPAALLATEPTLVFTTPPEIAALV
jgi:phosphoglycolate phosphatase